MAATIGCRLVVHATDPDAAGLKLIPSEIVPGRNYALYQMWSPWTYESGRLRLDFRNCNDGRLVRLPPDSAVCGGLRWCCMGGAGPCTPDSVIKCGAPLRRTGTGAGINR